MLTFVYNADADADAADANANANSDADNDNHAVSSDHCAKNGRVLSMIHLKLKQSELEMGNELGTSNITLFFCWHFKRRACVHIMSWLCRHEA